MKSAVAPTRKGKGGQKKVSAVSVVGLGKLGACLAACLAHKGFTVIGYDANEQVALLLNGGKSPVVEPGLEKMIAGSARRLSATTDCAEIIDRTNVTFIIVPTPSKKDGNFSSAYLEDVFAKLAPHLKTKKGRHLFVINSTVTPLTTDSVLIPLIEKKSGKKAGRDFSVCYNPEFIALGDVIRGILEPDVVLIGEGDRKAGDDLEMIYAKLCDNKPYIARMPIVSAEIMKIALNSFVTMKISFANTLGNICERIPGADVDAITSALGADKRISPHYLKAGLPFGGPCFPRDNRAFRSFAKSVGVEAVLASATDRVHDVQIDNLYAKIADVLKRGKHRAVSVLGLSYKPKTGVIEESAAVKLVERIIDGPVKVALSLYDRYALQNTKALFGDRARYGATVQECLADSACWIVATPEKDVAAAVIRAAKGKKITIIDCWRTIDPTKLGKGSVYLSLGGNLYE